jgi:LuxR family maltose regulon positive regulatory protein
VTLSILSTKLFIPPLRQDALPRVHLVEKVNAGREYPLTLISASAGSGKTTILSEWAAQADRQVAWVSLEPSDDDPAQFLAYFISAIQTIHRGFGEETLDSLQNVQGGNYKPLLTSLINEIARLPENFSLVFDDYHTITDASINELVVFLIEHSPPQLQLIFTSRIDPPWPLARFRARSQIYELRGQDLLFSVEEAAEFLNHTMGLNLSADQVKALEKRTEGWIAGLQLAALSIQGQRDVSGFIDAFAGSDIYIAEYLIEEILNRQPDDIQAFLLQTSILGRFNAELCQAVTGVKNGQALLADLFRANVFLIPLDNEGNWYRYHHLFTDLLRVRLNQNASQDQIAGLHRRAAHWFERSGQNGLAVAHAVEARDFDKAAELIGQNARPLLFAGRLNKLRAWLDSMPEESFQAHPHLRFFLFWIDVLQGTADLAPQSIRAMDTLLDKLPPSEDNRRLRGEFMAVVCRAVTFSGRTAEGIRLAEAALEYLPTDALSPRARVNSALATAHDLEGRPDLAGLAYREAVDQALAARDYRLAAHTLMAEGLIQVNNGKLHQAAGTFQQIIDLAELAGQQGAPNGGAGKVFFPAGQGYIGLGSIFLEGHQLEKAESYLEQGVDLCTRGGLDSVFVGKIQMSRLRQAQGDLEGAMHELQMPDQGHRVDAFDLAARQVRLALAQGDIDKAQPWAKPIIEIISDPSASKRVPLIFLEGLELVAARFHLAQGEIDQCLALLEKLQATAAPGDRMGPLIDAHLLRALAFQKMNAGSITTGALTGIATALELGSSQGYLLLFLEEGPALIPLLEAVIDSETSSGEIKRYAQQLLEASAEAGRSGQGSAVPTADELIEQLTPREMEVLRLIAAGDSNQQIAEKLVITVRTVKKHTGNIYGKLNVGSRTQAVAFARQIGLLSSD